MSRHNDIRTWEIFLNVVNAGSISAAADACDMEPSNISRSLSLLEKSLGTNLFERRSPPLALTYSGEIALQQAKIIVSAHNRLTQNITKIQNDFSGVIRLGMPHAFLERMLLNPCIQYKDKYKNVRLEIHDYNDLPPVNFLKKGKALDVIIGYGPDTSQQHITQIYLGECICAPMVAPSYVSIHGMPKNIEDLKHHRLLFFDNCNVPSNGYFVETGKHNIAAQFGECVSYPTNTTVLTATLLGTGIHYGLQYLYSYKLIQEGKLIPFSHIWTFPHWHFYLFVNPATSSLEKVKALVNILEEHLKKEISQCNEFVTSVI